MTLTSAVVAVVLTAAAGGKFDAPKGDVALVAQALSEAVVVLESPASSEEDRDRAIDTARKIARARIAPQSIVAERLGVSTRESAEAVLREVLEMLSFVPVHEAELPDGAPTFTPVGVIEVKRYPTVRKAVAKEFFTLFMHIKKNDIAMTTPVQMEYELSDSGRLKQKNMAFFYGSPATGQTGRDGRVDVVEMKPVTVIATGVRGRRSDEVIRDRIERLNKWLEAQKVYQKAGPIRLMGYNSPFVPASKQFYEVQIPIRKGSIAASP